MNDQWQHDLVRFAFNAHGTPFEWGRWDCTLLAFRVLSVITGQDHHSEILDKWSSRKSAYRYSLKMEMTFEDYLRASSFDYVTDGALKIGDYILSDQTVESRKLWKRPSVYLSRNKALTANETAGKIAVLNLSQIPDYSTVMRLNKLWAHQY